MAYLANGRDASEFTRINNSTERERNLSPSDGSTVPMALPPASAVVTPVRVHLFRGVSNTTTTRGGGGLLQWQMFTRFFQRVVPAYSVV